MKTMWFLFFSIVALSIVMIWWHNKHSIKWNIITGANYTEDAVDAIFAANTRMGYTR